MEKVSLIEPERNRKGTGSNGKNISDNDVNHDFSFAVQSEYGMGRRSDARKP
ncbi:hypothetical protein D3C71_1300410 [compost metagenome]